MPKVSIVLPIYNGEKYMKQSIDSILCQDFAEWELIIVNDCSTDLTPEIADAYAKKDERIKVIHNKENKKLPESLNIGFREACGECLTWTSDDNMYMPNAIGEMYQKLTSDESVKMVCADMKFMDADGRIVGQAMPYEEKRMLYENCVGACFMYKREVPEQVGGYDSDMFCVEDYDYWFRVLLKFGKIERLDQCLYLYRWHDNSLTETKKEKIQLQLCRLREKYRTFILDNLTDNQELICAMYYEFLEIVKEEGPFVRKAREMIPELANERENRKNSGRYVIFGAGEIGEKAFQELKGNAAFFVDNNKNKQGQRKCDLVIEDISTLKERAEEYRVLVAVSNRYVYPILHQLYEEGIFNYVTYPIFKLEAEEKAVLTVVVPVYNVSQYLGKCVESILAQSYQNMEILLIDDGSTDSSWKICDEYAKRDERIRVIHKKNQGLVQARKTGVEQATGSVIAFVDGDDWIEPDMYQSMMQHMDEDVDMVTSGLIYDWSQKKKETVLFDGLGAGVYNREKIRKILPCMIYDNKTGKQQITTSVCNKLFRAELLKGAIKTVDGALTLGEDGALMCSFVAKAQKITVTSLAKYHYIQHEQSMIRQYDFDAFRKIFNLQQCLLHNARDMEPGVNMRLQIEYYVKAFLENAVKSVYQIDNIAMHYIFPYECVEKGSKIILYGAGIVGRAYQKCIQGGDYAKIVMWVDRDWENKSDYPMAVENPQLISTVSYDYIVVAIENEEIAAGIVDELRNGQIPTEKIIWKKPFFVR